MEEEGQAPPVEKTQEQLEEEQKQKLEEERLKEQERRRLQQQARLKAEDDLRKLQQALKGALTSLGKTANGKTMAYNRLVLAQKQLQRLFPTILRFKEIRYLDLNTNAIADLSVITEFPNLIWINASKNQVQNLQIFNSEKLQHLQSLNLSSNKIKALSSITLPSLRRLNLSQNEIVEVSWKGHNCIQILQLRKNKLRKLKGIQKMKNLKQLYVCENQLTDIRGLEALPNLQKLSVRNNKLKGIYAPFPYLPGLTYLNVRENQIAKFDQLKKIDLHVTGLNLLQNPITEEHGQNLKKELIYVMPHLIKINKSEVTIEERVAFQKQLLQKLAEKEKERLLQEQEARRAAEEGKVEA